MKKIYLKSLLVTTLCLVLLSANAQVIRNVVKGSVDVKRQVDGKRSKLISDGVIQTTPPNIPHVREIKVLPKPIIFKKNLLSIPAIGADSTIFKRGMSFLEKGDTIGAISCFEVIKEKSPAAEGMLGILHCITSYGNRAIGRVNLLGACYKGDINAIRFLGMSYMMGENSFAQDEKMALHYFNRGAKKGDVVCEIERDRYLIMKDSVNKDVAFPSWEKIYKQALAGEGEITVDDIAMHLAYMGIDLYTHTDNIGLKDEAWQYITAAANCGEPNACLFKGKVFSEGDELIKENIDSAYFYTQRAADTGRVDLQEVAENGNRLACNLMAIKYHYAGSPDIDKAIYWYEKSASLGDAGAMLELADIYSGMGKESLAAEYARRSAEKGCYKGIIAYAKCLEKGYGVKKDEELARQYYLKAEKAKRNK